MQVYPMATARKLSLMFVVAVLVGSICFADVAQGAVIGQTVRATKLQEQPGTGPSFFVPLEKGTFFEVDCRLESSAIVDDNWWLKVFLVKGGQHGYVADYDGVCDGDTPAGHCDTAMFKHHICFFLVERGYLNGNSAHG